MSLNSRSLWVVRVWACTTAPGQVRSNWAVVTEEMPCWHKQIHKHCKDSSCLLVVYSLGEKEDHRLQQSKKVGHDKTLKGWGLKREQASREGTRPRWQRRGWVLTLGSDPAVTNQRKVRSRENHGARMLLEYGVHLARLHWSCSQLEKLQNPNRRQFKHLEEQGPPRRIAMGLRLAWLSCTVSSRLVWIMEWKILHQTNKSLMHDPVKLGKDEKNIEVSHSRSL